MQAVRLRLYVCGIVASEVIHKTNNGHHVFTKDNSKIWIIVQHPPGQALNRVHPPELYCQVQARQRGGKNLARFVPCDKCVAPYVVVGFRVFVDSDCRTVSYPSLSCA